MAKGLQKPQRLVFAVVMSDPEESTISDVQGISRKRPYFLPCGKAEYSPSPMLPRVRRSLLQPHPWTPWISGILDFCNVRLTPKASRLLVGFWL